MSTITLGCARANDELFVIVAKELSLCRRDTVLWDKAAALEHGDALKTVARYVRLRVDNLKQKKQQRVIQLATQSPILPPLRLLLLPLLTV